MFSDYFQLKRNFSGPPERPLGAFLYITNKCNLKCSFCEIGVAEEQPDKDMTTGEVLDILRQLAEWKVKELYITGGEPFLRKDIWEVLQFCIDNGISVSHITTNGTLFKRMTREQLQILKESTRLIQISIDSPLGKEHNASRGMKGIFEDIEAVMNSDRSQLPNMQFSSFITEGNYRNLPMLIELSAKLNANHINFTPVNFVSNFPEMGAEAGKDEAQFQTEEKRKDLLRVINSALNTSNKLGQSSNLEVLKLWIEEYFRYLETGDWFFHHVMPRFICSKPFNYLHINYYGDLMACSLLEGGENIRGKDIKKSWINLAEAWKKKMLDRQYLPECRSCYCDFPTNLRNSLAYHPIANLPLIMKLAPYYLNRRNR